MPVQALIQSICERPQHHCGHDPGLQPVIGLLRGEQGTHRHRQPRPYLQQKRHGRRRRQCRRKRRFRFDLFRKRLQPYQCLRFLSARPQPLIHFDRRQRQRPGADQKITADHQTKAADGDDVARLQQTAMHAAAVDIRPVRTVRIDELQFALMQKDRAMHLRNIWI